MAEQLNIEVELDGKLAGALDKIQQATGETYASIINVLLAAALFGMGAA